MRHLFVETQNRIFQLISKAAFGEAIFSTTKKTKITLIEKKKKNVSKEGQDEIVKKSIFRRSG